MNLPKVRSENIAVQKADKELLIYDLESNRAFCLNETSAPVWHLCDGQTSLTDLSRKVSQKLNTVVSEEFSWLSLTELKKCKLLRIDNVVRDSFAGISRREVVKRIGISSSISLLFISSIVAPSAVTAQSVSGLFAPCDNTILCPTGLFCGICASLSGGDPCPPSFWCYANAGI